MLSFVHIAVRLVNWSFLRSLDGNNGRRIARCKQSPMGNNKIVGKFGKDSPTILLFILRSRYEYHRILSPICVRWKVYMIFTGVSMLQTWRTYDKVSKHLLPRIVVWENMSILFFSIANFQSGTKVQNNTAIFQIFFS